ncbi:PAQR family membrane homeostasis protein TrhA [Marivirga harenae]|uniref:PAQR family membrane homeostasis protein TrhA n=1 Tax=Marivirga harenae TaxID=2010992 RepID=UPI0026E04669|nr:hemolysin III family protein [Marivirga harenae]WKV11411.1 hemolysin III family protein [Marivirga harenae]
MKTIKALGFEEPIGSWTHLLGALAVVVLLIWLFRKGGAGRRYPLPIFIYGLSCIFLLSMSGVYHILPRATSARYVLRILDHAGIFILISGTITSVHLLLFSGFMRWGIIGIASIIATIGIILSAIYMSIVPDIVTHIIYLVFGWLGVVSIIGLLKLRKDIVIKYLIYGGIAYSIGAVIDLLGFPVLVAGVLGAHEVFHFAVLLGAAFHWVFLLKAIQTVEATSINK